MSKPVVIEVNNKCGCHWNPGVVVTLTSQHPEGSASYTAHAFTCKVLDDRGLYLYSDTRPNGYRFWCTHCKNTDPMSFTYLTDQQTEFIAQVMRRFNVVDEQKKKLERRIQELTDTLAEERETFERTLAEQTAAAESQLQTALREATENEARFRKAEAKWNKEEAERNEYNKRKSEGLALLAPIGAFKIDACSRDDLGEESRDFMRAGEEMTKLVAALLNVQGNIGKCAAQEARLEGNPQPPVEKKNALLLRMLRDVFGADNSGPNCVPLLDPTGVTWSLDDPNSPGGSGGGNNGDRSEKDDASATSDTASRTSHHHHPSSPTAKDAAAAAAELQKRREELQTTPVVHVPFDYLAVNAATQNIRRLPKANYRLCPNHDVCSAEANCTYFHLKTTKIRFARAGEVLVPLAFVLNKNELPGSNSSGGGGGGNSGGGGGGGGGGGPSLTAAMKAGTVPEGCIEPNCHCRSRVHVHQAAAKLTFATWRERDDIWKFAVTTTESDHMSGNLDDLKREKNRFERFLSRHPNVLGPPKPPRPENNSNDNGGGAVVDEEEEEDEEDTSHYPDGSIAGLEAATFACFRKARENMMEEFLRLRSMYTLLATFDFHFLQMAQYAESCRRFFKVPRDLDELVRCVTETALRFRELMEKPKPTLGVEGKAYAIGVALAIRETERTFEELQLLRDRVDLYKGHIDRSSRAHALEREIEHIERQIDHKQKELVRTRKKIELIEADLEVLADAEDQFEAQEKRSERSKTLNEAQTKQRELVALQEQHHERFVFLAETKTAILPDLDLRDSEQKRWTDLLGEGNEALPGSKNLVDFVKNKRLAAGQHGSPLGGMSFGQH